MKRFLSLLFFVLVIVGILALWRSQQVKEQDTYKIGALTFTGIDKVTFAGFKEGMKQLGYGGEGKAIEYRFENVNGDRSRLQESIEKLLAFQPDLIFVSSTPATQAVQGATRQNKIPVVFGPVNDPVASGIVQNIRNPAGHITGIRLSPSDTRRLQLFHQMVPQSRTLFLPYHPDDNSSVASFTQIMSGAEKLGITILPRKILKEGGLAHAIQNFPKEVDGIFLPRDSRVEAKIDDWVALSLRYKIPLCVPSRQQIDNGALFSYGFSHKRIGQQAARLASQILQGVDPGTLPIEAAENLSFLNMKTAQAIGLELPDKTLRQMNEIIR